MMLDVKISHTIYHRSVELDLGHGLEQFKEKPQQRQFAIGKKVAVLAISISQD